MNCPNCNTTLTLSERQGVEIDFCPQCRGVWLDRGELDKIIERSDRYDRDRDGDDDDSNRRRRAGSDRQGYAPPPPHYPPPQDYRQQHHYHKKKKSFWHELFD